MAQLYEVGTIIILILKMKILRLRAIKELSYDRPAGMWWTLNLNPDTLTWDPTY